MAVMMINSVDLNGTTVSMPTSDDGKFGVQVGQGVLYLTRDEALALFHQLGDVLGATHGVTPEQETASQRCTCGHRRDEHSFAGASLVCVAPGSEYHDEFADNCMAFTPTN